MTTNISRQLTTSVLALAGSVAAFGLADAAQAAILASVEFRGLATIPAWGSTNPTLDPTNVNLILDSTGTFAGVTTANITIPQPLTLTGTGTGPGTSFGFPPPVPSFVTITTGAGPVVVNITPTFAFGTNATSGTPTTSYTVTGDAVFDEPTGPDFLGTFSITFNRTDVLQNYTLVLTQTGEPALSIPEPSAILGILALAGVGTFARRKS